MRLRLSERKTEPIRAACGRTPRVSETTPKAFRSPWRFGDVSFSSGQEFLGGWSYSQDTDALSVSLPSSTISVQWPDAEFVTTIRLWMAAPKLRDWNNAEIVCNPLVTPTSRVQVDFGVCLSTSITQFCDVCAGSVAHARCGSGVISAAESADCLSFKIETCSSIPTPCFFLPGLPID